MNKIFNPEKYAMTALVLALITATAINKSFAQLVPYTKSYTKEIPYSCQEIIEKKPSVKISEHYNWQQTPYSETTQCRDEYIFYDNDNNGKMDEISILLDCEGRGRKYYQECTGPIDFAENKYIDQEYFSNKQFAEKKYKELLKKVKTQKIDYYLFNYLTVEYSKK